MTLNAVSTLGEVKGGVCAILRSSWPDLTVSARVRDPQSQGGDGFSGWDVAAALEQQIGNMGPPGRIRSSSSPWRCTH
jgi:hypothetical protein